MINSVLNWGEDGKTEGEDGSLPPVQQKHVGGTRGQRGRVGKREEMLEAEPKGAGERQSQVRGDDRNEDIGGKRISAEKQRNGSPSRSEESLLRVQG